MPSYAEFQAVAAANDAPPPHGAPEGMAPSTVNDTLRYVMAALRDLGDRAHGPLVWAGAAAGSADAIMLDHAPRPETPLDGQVVRFRTAAANTGPATLQLGALPALPIRKGDGTAALGGGDLPAGAVVTVLYEAAAGGRFRLLHASRETGAPVPVGLVAPFAGAVAPAGWLLCHGQAVDRASHAALFAVIGTTYGAGNGSTTFNLPDLRGRVAAGRDNMGGVAAGRVTDAGTGHPGVNGAVLGAAGGSDRHALTIAQMPAHTHRLASGSGGDFAFNNDSGSWASPRETSSTGGGEAHPNLQPTLILNYVIYAGAQA